ncbi:MAG: ABC transporter substrate-binding protein [Spirochaetota bacterium]
MTDNVTVLLPYVKIEDPHLCTDAHALLVIRRLLFPGLLQHDGTRGYGVLAEKWESSEAGKTWRFTLKRGRSLENGNELTAEDVVYSLKRAADPSVAGQLFTVTYNEYFGNADIYSEDRYTVVLKNPQPIADLEELLPDLAILPNGWKDYEDGAGAGWYRLREQDENSVRLERRVDAPSERELPQSLTFEAVADADERAKQIMLGKAHLALDPPAESIDTLIQRPETIVFGWDTSLSVIFFIDCRMQPLDDVRVRQALNYAVDTEGLIEAVALGHGKALNGPFSDRHFARDPQLRPYSYDPQKAQDLLRQAGVPEDFVLEVHAPTSIPEEGPALARYLADCYEQIGLQTKVRLHQDRSEYARQITAKELHGIFCFDSSPLSSYKVLHEKLDSRFGGVWWQGYHSDEMNALISQASAADDTSERRQLYQQAYRILHNEAPWVFLYQPRRFWAVHTSFRITDQDFNDLGFFNFG